MSAQVAYTAGGEELGFRAGEGADAEGTKDLRVEGYNADEKNVLLEPILEPAYGPSLVCALLLPDPAVSLWTPGRAAPCAWGSRGAQSCGLQAARSHGILSDAEERIRMGEFTTLLFLCARPLLPTL